MTPSKPQKHRGQRKRLACGHLPRLHHKTWCWTCYTKTAQFKVVQKRYQQSEKGKAKNRRYSRSIKGLRRNSQIYFKKRFKGLSSYLAKYVIIPGNPVETARRWALKQATNRQASRRWYKRWGDMKKPTVRHRHEMIRSGKWKEAEHPL